MNLSSAARTLRHLLGIVAVTCMALSWSMAADPQQRGDSPVQSDYDREQRWADQVLPGLVVGDAVYLEQKNGHRFLSLFTEVKNPKGAVIVAHGRGTHPDWGLDGVLRVQLADAGYTTLSIQMPVLDAGGKLEAYLHLFGESTERLGLAAKFLEGKGYRNIGIVSHSLGARMTNEFLTGNPPPSIKAWVSIGIINGLQDTQWVKVPMLDLYGEKDWLGVLNGAGDRRRLIARIPGSEQIVVAGADHFFEGKEKELVGTVKAFLDTRLAKAVTAN